MSPNPDSSSYQYQDQLGSFTNTTTQPSQRQFDSPPIPSNQGDINLLNPEETLNELREPNGEIPAWLNYIKHQYTPPDDVDTLLLYPCAAQKPMPVSMTYRALSKTLDRYTYEEKSRIHTVTVSEPMGLIPMEFQDQQGNNPTWIYDTPGLFRWWCKDNNTGWNKQAQQMCLQILGKHIAGFIDRAIENDWYNAKIACVRHLTPSGGTTIDQTHRQMLEIVESITGVDLTWVPSEKTIKALSDKQEHAYTMQGVAYDPIQTELSKELTTALEA